MRSMSDPNNPFGWTNPTSPNNPTGWTNPFSPNNPTGYTNPFSPNNPSRQSQRLQEFIKQSEKSMIRSQQEADRSQRSLREFAKRTQSSSPRAAHSPRTGGAGVSLLGVILRLAVLAVVVVYALPHVLRPTPPVILSARQFVTANLESAATELTPPDLARSIDAFIGAISR